MEYKFEKNKIDLHVLREFCEREGEAVEYRKGDQLLMLNGMLTYCGLYGTSYDNDNENA